MVRSGHFDSLSQLAKAHRISHTRAARALKSRKALYRRPYFHPPQPTLKALDSAASISYYVDSNSSVYDVTVVSYATPKKNERILGSDPTFVAYVVALMLISDSSVEPLIPSVVAQRIASLVAWVCETQSPALRGERQPFRSRLHGGSIPMLSPTLINPASFICRSHFFVAALEN
jgi:hypothetical protein